MASLWAAAPAAGSNCCGLIARAVAAVNKGKSVTRSYLILSNPTMVRRQGLRPLFFKFPNVAAKEAAEKVLFVVIPSAARDLLFRKSQEKSRFLGQNPPSE